MTFVINWNSFSFYLRTKVFLWIYIYTQKPGWMRFGLNFRDVSPIWTLPFLPPHTKRGREVPPQTVFPAIFPQERREIPVERDI